MYFTLIFMNITLSKYLILEQHKIDEKRPKKMQFISSTKYLNIRWDGHYVVILVLFVSHSIPNLKNKNVSSWAA